MNDKKNLNPFPNLLRVSTSAESTQDLGRQIGEKLRINGIVALMGDLGSGKTTFVKGLVFGAAKLPPETASSPTFNLLNIYSGEKTIYHFDLYRLQSADDFFNLGFDEFFFSGGICCIEWPEKILPSLPTFLRIELSHEAEDKRQLSLHWEEKQ